MMETKQLHRGRGQSGLDALVDDGDVPYTVSLTTDSDDPDYAAFAGGSPEKEYEFSLDPSILNPADNQIFAYAESSVSHQSAALPVTSPHEWIWIIRLSHLYIPLVSDD
jgi:hypothetical protein